MADAAAASSMQCDSAPPPSSTEPAAAPAAAPVTNDSLTSADYYFNSYSHFGIHEEMLKDEVRTNSYRTAILRNKHLFRDKIVLDVGCGTGVLSMFCAQAGAKHVYGIECSDIIDFAWEIVKVNGFENVTLIKGKVEEVTLPVPHVDIIVSEWMGYFLFYESMLDTVIFARDKWLAPGGLLFPDKASLYAVAIEDGQYKEEKIEFWNNVYGFNMTPIRKVAMREPLVDTVEPASIISSPVCLMKLDVSTVKKEELRLQLPFELNFTRDDFCHALVFYFDIQFSACHKPINFSTGPTARYTHWKQTVFYLNNTLVVKHGEKLAGTLSCVPNVKNPRDLDIEISYRFDGANGSVADRQEYRMR
eukprot:gnl/Hemi2/11322_TR3918_c0_g1_i1.p1 gnl/Hemi2/11322_TR3918_c0_g1~~gnl/Hemi2/11322_TR3918_c0_g1_i1.p1  ORF type:complete len:361 (+),score=110.90 gnl/Hemi2/11322_TR3918_c0_g1_i1:138-1220(+)